MREEVRNPVQFNGENNKELEDVDRSLGADGGGLPTREQRWGNSKAVGKTTIRMRRLH